MCGIIALLRRPAAVQPVELSPLVDRLTEAGDRLEGDGETPRWEALGEAAAVAASVDRSLRGLNGAASLLADPVEMAQAGVTLSAIQRTQARAADLERHCDNTD